MKAQDAILDTVYTHLENRKPPHTFSGNVFASEVGHCERKIGYRLGQVGETNPMPRSSQWNFYIGDVIHDMVQAALVELNPDADAEVRWELQGVSGRADLHQRAGAGGVEEIIEIKLTDEELTALNKSASSVEELVEVMHKAQAN